VPDTIHFQRPETPRTVSKMYIAAEPDLERHIHHLEALGYTIVDISPSLSGPTTFPTRGANNVET